MKHLKRIALQILGVVFLLSVSSCAVFVSPGQDRGRHTGWYKQRVYQGHPVRVNQGYQVKTYKQSESVNPPAKSNKGKHKGNTKK